MASDNPPAASRDPLQLRALAFQYSQDSQILLDGSGNVVDLNNRALEMLDCAPDSVIGAPLRDSRGGGHQRAIERLLAGAEAARQSQSWSGQIDEPRLHATATLITDGSASSHVLLTIRELPSEAAFHAPAAQPETQVLRMILDTLTDPVFFKDREGRHCLQNEANRRFFGLSDAELLGKTAFDVPIHRERAGIYAAEDHEVLTRGEPLLNREELRQCVDGKARWFLTSKFPVRDADGAIFGLIGISQEITQRRDAERALATERYLLQTVIDSVHDVIFLKDRNCRYVLVNAAFCRMFGVHDATAAGHTSESIPGSREYAEQYRADDETVLRTGIPLINREEPFQTPDGRSGWFLTSKVPLRNGNGETTGLVGSCRDITEIKRAAYELEHERQRFVDHVENTPLAVIEWTPELCVQRWSARSEAIFGWSASDVLGKNYREWKFIHPDDEEKVVRLSTDLIERRVARNISRNRNLTKSGDVVYCVWHNSVLHDADGRAVSVLSLIQDVTEQVLADESIAASRQEKQAMEEKMRETQRLESLGILAGGIAHDFNNLLAVILGNASLAASDIAADSPAQEFLTEVEEASMRAAALCKQMLAYAGKDTYAIEETDLNGIVAEMIGLLKVSLSKKVQLQTTLAADLPKVLADKVQLKQVVMNLVINASEALDDRTGTVEIVTRSAHIDARIFEESRCATDLPQGDYVVIEIRDSGCGMPPEIQARIFDPFFTTKFTGRGLGLAAVLGIVRAHHGAIRVRSAVGSGTTIEVYLPRSGRAFPEIDETLTEKAPLEKRGTVLVADDEESVRTATVRMLRKAGYEVIEAEDGAAALRQVAAAGGHVDLVLLDLLMPVLDGRETSRRLLELHPRTRVIIMSGYSESEAAVPIERGEVTSFLQKPFTQAELLEQVRKALFS